MFPLRKILVPTDFSPCAATALDHAVELAKALRAEILLLHVIPDFDYFIPSPDLIPVMPQLLESTRTLAGEQLDKERHRIKGVVVGTELRQGRVHETILAAAQAARADLIVIGTHGRTGITHALLGSVAERIVRLSPIPVLTVRKPE